MDMTSSHSSVSLDRIEVRRWSIALRLTRPFEFPFQHGRVARVLLASLVDRHDLPAGLVPFSPESGRTSCEEGERYTFGVTAIGGNHLIVERALRLLLEGGHRRRPRLTAFGGLFEVVGEPDGIPIPDLAAEAQALQSRAAIACQFLSPFRLKRPPELCAEGASFLNGDCWPWSVFARHIVWRAMTCMGLKPSREDLERAGAWPGEVVPGQLVWCDLPDSRITTEHERRDPAHKKRNYTLGGVVGSVLLRGVPAEAAPWLALAHHLHVGEHTSFGLGRFAIDALGGVPAEPFQSAESLLLRALAPEVLQRAEAHLRAAWQRQGGHDGRLHSVAVDAAEQLRRGVYQVRPLRRFGHRQSNGHQRSLSVPEWPDRVLQRAVHEALLPSVEALLSSSSFAYRHGHSREGAAQVISRAWREGYRWVLDGDVSAFFDSVVWSDVDERLHALIPFHPDLRAIITRWVRAPLVEDGVSRERSAGLPVGMPLSPLLSNLLLDAFDRVITDHGFRLVRFADDFVILCRDRDAAVSALEQARTSLASMHLRLHDAKTRITNFEEGFAFLGYRFGADGGFTPIVPADAGHDHKEPGGRGMLPRAPRSVRTPTAASPALEELAPADLLPLAAASGAGYATQPVPVHVFDPATQVHVEHESLRIVLRGGEVLHFPLSQVRHLVVNQSARMSLPCIARCAEHGIPVFLVRRNGSLLASTLPEPSWPVVLAQVEFQRDAARRVAVGRSMIAAKLHNAATLVVRLQWRNGARRAAAIRRAEAGVRTAPDLGALRGHEGAGAALWFDGLVKEVPAEWMFRARRKHPSTDPVNAMLSLGYTTLHHHAVTALAAAGLLPSAGIFHEPHAGHQALASDLVEEFRFLVDGVVWRALRQPECTPADFTVEGDACLLRDEYRRTFLSRLEARLLSPAAASAGRHSYRALLDAQARQLREIFLGTRVAYDAVRLHG